MKVNFPVKEAADLKVIKEELKQYGGRCAKIVEGNLEYQIKEENQEAAYSHLREKGIIE